MRATDEDLKPQILALYAEGHGIHPIVKQLQSSETRVRRILQDAGVDTTGRRPKVKQTHNHPYDLCAVMEERGWTVDFLCNRLGVGRTKVKRWRREGIEWSLADEIAIRTGYMPQDLGWVDEADL